MDPLLAMIFLFGSNFAPQGYAFCSGQLLAIASNTAVFSLLGTTYGGNGTNNFALPDLRGRVPLGQGQGPGLNNYTLGQSAGSETVTINATQMPPHSHQVNVNLGPGSAPPGSTTYLSAGPSSGSGPNASVLNIYTTGANIGNTAINPGTIAMAGGGQPFTILQPYLAISYVIAMQGVFPTRN
jgi:microcystin-dependent protein